MRERLVDRGEPLIVFPPPPRRELIAVIKPVTPTPHEPGAVTGGFLRLCPKIVTCAGQLRTSHI